MKSPSLLSRLERPEAIKSFTLVNLRNLAGEVRQRINEVVHQVGGHLGPNLGAVELIIGCHYVFDLDRDRLIFDVGHQVYPHKLLTGRNQQFMTLRQKAGISGYPNQNESHYDVFRGGHASTAISTALGFKCGTEIARPQKPTHIIALVGDGAMTGGMAFEGLNQTGYLQKPLIVILNDNSMSISPTVGALSKAFTYFRHLDLYKSLRDRVQGVVENIPKVGRRVRGFTDQVLKDIQNIVSPAQIFTTLGFEYIGPINGNNLPDIIKSLKLAKKLNRPVLIHAVTQKGLGYKPDGITGKTIIGPHALAAKKKVGQTTPPVPPKPSYSKIFTQTLIKLAQNHPNIVTITAAMAEGTGLVQFGEKYPQRYFDVGICEAHATGFAAGLAASKCRPVFAVYSTFLQRAFDQIFHDIVLQAKLPVIFCIDRAGLVGDDGPSHHGLYDIAYLRIFPHMILMAPKDASELQAMLTWAVKQPVSVAIRYPKTNVPSAQHFQAFYPRQASAPVAIRLGKAEVLRWGKQVCLWGYGAMVYEVSLALDILAQEEIYPTFVNARFAKPLDKPLLRRMLAAHNVIITLEEASEVGGMGSAVVEAAQTLGLYQKPIQICGVPDKLIEHASRKEQLVMSGLAVNAIVRQVRKWWKKNKG